MAFNKAIKREIEVAFSKHSQPLWFRLLKYILLGCLLYFLWGSELLWIILLLMFVLAMMLHLWYRYKTRGWTRSYGLWKHENDRADQKNK
jgi:hypothetical protein